MAVDGLPKGKPVVFYLDWGRYDARCTIESWDTPAANKRLAAGLAKKGLEVRGKEFGDGGDWIGWRDRTGYLIETLYGLNQ